MIVRGCDAWLKAFVLPAAVGAALTVVGQAAALPLSKELARTTPLLPVEDGAAADPAREADGGEDAVSGGQAPLAELTAALAAARAKLAELNRAAEALGSTAALRAELTAREAELAARAEEDRRRVAELQALQTDRAAWQRAEDAAKAEIAGLAQALDETTAEAKKLDAELAAVRWQNAQLDTSLNEARSDHEAARAELEARVDELTTDAARSETEIRRLAAELADRSAKLTAANRAQEAIAAQTTALQQALDEADGELSRARDQLAATRERLNAVNTALSAAEQERDTALADLDEERARSDRLRGALTVADADLARTRAANRDLETRLTGLEEAAMMATDAARQNLLAVEDQIAALNSTLARADLAAAATTADVSAGGQAAAIPAAMGDGSERAARKDAAPAPPTRSGPEGDAEMLAVAAGPAAGPADVDLASIKRSAPTAPDLPKALGELTAALPMEGRIQAQSLLADLEVEPDPQGVKLIVPGGELFTVNGDEVRETAHDSLARVAELVNLYKNQPVLIVGHTDAIGAQDYNQTLSERRAGLVQQFFVDYFDVEASRLSTQGMGEQKPIASNATAAGRRANRRVEVLILN